MWKWKQNSRLQVNNRCVFYPNTMGHFMWSKYLFPGLYVLLDVDCQSDSLLFLLKNCKLISCLFLQQLDLIFLRIYLVMLFYIPLRFKARLIYFTIYQSICIHGFELWDTYLDIRKVDITLTLNLSWQPPLPLGATFASTRIWIVSWYMYIYFCVQSMDTCSDINGNKKWFPHRCIYVYHNIWRTILSYRYLNIPLYN